jgi:hypothetical protein
MKLKKLEKEDISIFKKYLDYGPQHSSYSLSEIFLWNGCVWDVFWMRYEDYLIIAEEPKNNEEKRIFLPLPYLELKVEKLYEILKDIKYNAVYYVGSDYIELHKDKLMKFFEIKENFNYSDYLYLSKDLALLKGSKYSAKRNLINQFEKNYILNTVVESFNIKKIDEIINFSKYLFKNSSIVGEKEILECEIEAISNIKKFWDEIEFFGVCVYIDNKLKGFAIGSVLNNQTCILNFEKADKNIKGLYQFLDKSFAKSVSQRFKYINKESDLGIESLKISKLSYHPIKIINSFILKPRI